MSSFQCSGCGACCRRVAGIPNFPEPINEDGSCMHLQEDNSCGIYETRPTVCNVKEYYKTGTYQQDFSTIVDWYVHNSEICNVFILEDGLPEKYLINLAKYKK